MILFCDELIIADAALGTAWSKIGEPLEVPSPATATSACWNIAHLTLS